MTGEVERQLRELARGAAGVYTEADLGAKLDRSLAEKRPLRVKLGVDPTAPDLHLGHTVVLRKLRAFQDLGHQAIFLIGDFTARVGDPSGRQKTRPPLSPSEIEANAKTYLEQAGAVLDVPRLEIRRNSEWFLPIPFQEWFSLCARLTASALLQREDFRGRLRDGQPVGLHELLYPVLQAYDSVMLKADVELGGVDQTLNILMGREIQPMFEQEAQVGLVVPILIGIGGGEKMSKSYGNHIGVREDAYSMFAKLMSIPDALMRDYFTLLTRVPQEEVASLLEASRTHPKEAKKRLAREIAAGYHPAEAAAAEAEWERTIARKEAPEEMPELAIDGTGPVWIVDLVRRTGVAKSSSEARRLIEQGAVEIDGVRCTNPMDSPSARTGAVLRIGKKRQHFRIRRAL